MKTIEERVNQWAVLPLSDADRRNLMRMALIELADDLNAEKEQELKEQYDRGRSHEATEQEAILAEKEKEVAELKTAIQELSNSKVSGDQRCAKYIGEIAELQAWKESALKVMPDFQKLGKLLGLPIGSSVSEQLVPAVEKQTALLDEAKRVLAWYVGEVGPDFECTCEHCRNHAAAHSLLTRLGGASHE